MPDLKTAALPLTLLLLGAALSSPAHAANLKVRSVSTARSATAGSEVAVQVGVTRTGRTAPARVHFYLSADRKRDGRDVRLRGEGRLRRGGPSRAVRVAARPKLPGGQALGDYRLIACVDDPSRVRERSERDNCRAARPPLRVTATPVGTRDLVEAAVAARKITPGQGLLYRVYDAFGDARLPAAYSGDDAAAEHTIMRDVIDEWPRLSSAERAKLQPFLVPPAGKGSWTSRGAGRARSAAGDQPACNSDPLAKLEWRTIAKPGGHVRIWWLKADEKRIGPRARSFVAEVENTIWPRLRDVFGREPLSDGRERCFHGVDSKLDIYMLRLDRKKALTVPYPPRCSATPSFIVFNAGGELPDRWEVAHELTHAFQFAFRTGAACSNYDDWDEAVANWGAAFAYPDDNSEHLFRWFLRDPETSLADADYEGWVFPYALERLHGAGTIRKIFEEGERRDVLDAIDAGVPGGLEKIWPEFARLAWNQDPVSPTFLQWDHFPQVPEVDGKPVAAERLDPGAAGQVRVDVPLGLKPLTRAYRHFKLGPGVRQITIEKPSFPGLSIQALVHTRGGSWRTEDWHMRQPVWCPTNPSERLDEIILVIANTSLTEASSDKVPLKLLATNIGCSRYTGVASGTSAYRTTSASIDESWNATGLVYERRRVTPDLPRFAFDLVAGSVTWSMSGQEGSCSVKAGPVTLPLRTDRANGNLDISAAIGPPWNRRYFAHGYGLPPVQGTVTCPSGTSTRYFTPRTEFLATSAPIEPLAIPPSGTLEGSSSPWQGSNVTAKYTWRLVPE